MPYYKFDYHEDDPDLIFWARVDLPDKKAVEEWLDIYREEQETVGDSENSIDDFLLFLRTHDIDAELCKNNGTIIF